MAQERLTIRLAKRWYVLVVLAVGLAGAANDLLDWTRTFGITWEGWVIAILVSVIAALGLHVRELERERDSARADAQTLRADSTSDVEAVIREFETLLPQVDDPQLHQIAWRTTYDQLVERAKSAVDPMYKAWLQNTDGLPTPPWWPTPQPAARVTPGESTRAQYRQLIQNQLTRLRDIASRQRARSGEDVGYTAYLLAGSKDQLLQASVAAQRLLNEHADRETVSHYKDRLREFATAALRQDLVNRLFSDESFPPASYRHPVMEDRDFEFLAKRQVRLSELQTQLSPSNIRDDFIPEDWKNYF